jgi:lipoprotein NlpD
MSAPRAPRRTTAMAIALALGLALGLGACSEALRFEPETPGLHTVRKGDTLYSIALRYDADWREVARWNGLAAPYTIEVGQQLKVMPPTSTTVAAGGKPGRTSAGGAVGARAAPRPPTPAMPPPTTRFAWAWPAEGRVVAQFRPGLATAKGIDIAGERGAEVRAAFDGKVVYVGSGLVGYGKVIIVKHDDRYLSAYAHNERFLVEEGATVKRGQAIAAMGLGPGQRALLHFEVRLDGRAIDPLPLLPKR